MARYVVLEFDNVAEANGFMSTFGDQPEGSTVRMIGVYQKPTLFCECATRSDKSVRGAKHGWWLCATCAKPKRGNMQHPLNKLSAAKPSEQAKEMYLGVREPRGQGYAVPGTTA